jgi:putative transposase
VCPSQPHLSGVFRRRKLPHWDVEGKPVFITACLEGSISAVGMKRIRAYRVELDQRKQPTDLSPSEWELKKDKLVFKLVDHLLDHQSAVSHLADPLQTQIVQDALLHFAGQRYSLFAFVVMPSHYHWLFLPKNDWQDRNLADFEKRTPREVISHSIQSYTATHCNKVRNANGQYWQHETFDHWIRDDDQLQRVIDYIENNPVKAGLASTPDAYVWSSARLRSELGIAPGDSILVG